MQTSNPVQRASGMQEIAIVNGLQIEGLQKTATPSKDWIYHIATFLPWTVARIFNFACNFFRAREGTIYADISAQQHNLFHDYKGWALDKKAGDQRGHKVQPVFEQYTDFQPIQVTAKDLSEAAHKIASYVIQTTQGRSTKPQDLLFDVNAAGAAPNGAIVNFKRIGTQEIRHWFSTETREVWEIHSVGSNSFPLMKRAADLIPLFIWEDESEQTHYETVMIDRKLDPKGSAWAGGFVEIDDEGIPDSPICTAFKEGNEEVKFKICPPESNVSKIYDEAAVAYKNLPKKDRGNERNETVIKYKEAKARMQEEFKRYRLDYNFTRGPVRLRYIDPSSKENRYIDGVARHAGTVNTGNRLCGEGGESLLSAVQGRHPKRVHQTDAFVVTFDLGQTKAEGVNKIFNSFAANDDAQGLYRLDVTKECKLGIAIDGENSAEKLAEIEQNFSATITSRLPEREKSQGGTANPTRTLAFEHHQKFIRMIIESLRPTENNIQIVPSNLNKEFSSLLAGGNSAFNNQDGSDEDPENSLGNSQDSDS